MSKERTKDNIIQNKKEAIKILNHMLETFINEPSGKYLKKADLIAYWLKEYSRLILFEKKFDPTKNIAYKRGDIIKLNLGFNIGSEHGGLHYGVVLDKHNHHSSPVLTIIPLTSVKDDKTIHPDEVYLGNEIYRSLKLKHDTVLKALNEEQEEIRNTLNAINILFESIDSNLEKSNLHINNLNELSTHASQTQEMITAAQKLKEDWEKKSAHNIEQIDYLSKIKTEISQMKQGSVAVINQITTVSKVRIYDPRNLKGVLAGISLSADSMDKINNKLKDMYIF